MKTFFFFILMLATLPAMAEKIEFFTENYPPFNYKANNQITGISVDLLASMFELMGSGQSVKDIKLTAWARSYFNALNHDNTVVFSTTRTVEREALFKWVGPIIDNKIVFIAKTSSGIKINSPQDLRKYTVVAVRDDVGETALHELAHPPSKVAAVTFPKQAVKLLQMNRVDLWVYGQFVAAHIQRESGIDPADYQAVYSYGSMGALYFAFNKNVSDKVIRRYQKALDQVKTEVVNGGKTRFEVILQSYGIEK